MADFPRGANVKPAINDIDKLIAALRGAGKAAGLAEDEIEKLVTTAKKGGSDGAAGIDNMKGQLSSLGGIAKTVGPALAGVFALDKLKQFVGEVVNITAEFQKFEAVLTNTLGSNSAAKRALSDITKFAAQTPFSVRELTDSFVKLANQGFKPNIEQLRQLGDLASATGKGFDQLTEAFLDAQTGQFERLKEFGIKASKQGDQVTFSFKGVQTQVDFTNEAMGAYLLTLGDVEGVSGSMAAISQTLGGQISNLGDSWDQLLKTIGDGNKGPLSGFVSFLGNAINDITLLIETNDQLTARLKSGKEGNDIESFNTFARAYKDRNEAFKVYIRLLDEELIKIKQKDDEVFRSGKSDGQFDERAARIGSIQAERATLLAYQEEQNKEILKKETAAADAVKTARVNAERKANSEIKESRNKFLKGFLADIASGKSTEDGEGTQGDFTFADPSLNLDGLKKVNEDLKAERDRAYEQEYEDKLAQQQRLIDAEKAHEENRRALKQAAFQFGVELVNTLYLISAQNMQAELSDLQASKDYELRLTGDNAKSKEKVNRDFAAKERALKRKQAQEQQELSMFNILASTAESIIKTGANLGYPAAVPFQIFAGLTGALQLAAVLNAKLPAFKDGVFDLMGAGTETSDSILARLSAHESVVPARKSRKFKDILKPIIEDENIGYGDLKSIIDRNIPNHLRGDLFVKLKAENDPVMAEMRDILKEIKNKPTTGKGIDAKGLYEYIERDGVVKKTYKQNYFW